MHAKWRFIILAIGWQVWGASFVMAQTEQADSGVEVLKPDRTQIDQIRREFELLPTRLEVEYRTRVDNQEGGWGMWERPEYLEITLRGEAAKLLEGRGYRETGLRCDVIFALYPYLESERDKEAYVILMAFVREAYLVRTPVGAYLPFSETFDENTWEKKKLHLISELKRMCRVSLRARLGTGLRTAYEVKDLESERLPDRGKASQAAEKRQGVSSAPEQVEVNGTSDEELPAGSENSGSNPLKDIAPPENNEPEALP